MKGKNLLDTEISWEEFVEADSAPRIYVGFAPTISVLKTIELYIRGKEGIIEETLFVFNPFYREAVLRNMDKLNENSNDPVVEISGDSLIDFFSRWSSQKDMLDG